MRTVTLNILYKKGEKGGRKKGRRKRKDEGVGRGRGGRERERESPSKREWIKMN